VRQRGEHLTDPLWDDHMPYGRETRCGPVLAGAGEVHGVTASSAMTFSTPP
jgi:hypothetical protein